MSEKTNPYLAKKSVVKEQPEQQNTASDQGHNQARTIAPKVIGIITVIFGVYNLIMSLIAASSLILTINSTDFGSFLYFHLAVAIITIVMSLWAIFIGIKLIKYLDSGRRQFNYYVILTLIILIGIMVYSQGRPPLVVLIKPILLIIMAVILNQQNMKNSLSN